MGNTLQQPPSSRVIRAFVIFKNTQCYTTKHISNWFYILNFEKSMEDFIEKRKKNVTGFGFGLIFFFKLNTIFD